jgi:hypothetical protein
MDSLKSRYGFDVKVTWRQDLHDTHMIIIHDRQHDLRVTFLHTDENSLPVLFERADKQLFEAIPYRTTPLWAVLNPIKESKDEQ